MAVSVVLVLGMRGCLCGVAVDGCSVVATLMVRLLVMSRVGRLR